MLAVTSGTTGDPKYIPVTNHFLREYRRGWNVWGLSVFRDHLDLLTKKTLQFSSDWHATETEAGIPCGSISGLAAETRPAIARVVFPLPALVNKIKGTTDKHYVILRLTMHRRNVGMMVTANPLTLLNLARLADRAKEDLIRDFFDGSISPDVDVPRALLESLRPRLSRRRVRAARRLERIVERTGHLWPRDFWPEISVLAVWICGTMGGYLPGLRELYGDVVFRDHGLSASEGRMTIPFGDGSRAGHLDYPTHYFEFVPVSERQKSDPTVLEAHELVPGEDYFIFLTTSGGLYRYDIHDIVRCVAFEGTCPLLEFRNKGEHFSSIAGEKLAERQVVDAVSRALEEVGSRAEHFVLGPEFGEPGRYVLLLEDDVEPASREPSRRALAASVDEHLARANCEYEDRLDSGRLSPLVVRTVPRGTWERLRRQRIGRDGSTFEQYKHPFLINDIRRLSPDDSLRQEAEV